MRNGNHIFPLRQPKTGIVLTVPMRNGNASFVSEVVSSFLSFLPYLWGMETLFLCRHVSIFFRFLPYLWGMETLVCMSSQRITLRSYRTYEEWKPTFSEYIATLSVCSYRTYEEWKQDTVATDWHTKEEFLPYLWGMETQAVSWRIRAIGKFLPYLWGMETFESIACGQHDTRFLPYLWGMETSEIH